MLIPQDREDEGPAILERVKRGEHVESYETVRRRKDGSLIDILLTVSPIRNAQGTIIGASKVSRDISERKRAQEHQQFLVRELEHRAKNLSAVIQSIVNRTLIEGQTVAGAKKVLTGRMMALAQAHSILADAAWRGAPLGEIIQRNFAGFSKRFDVSGCDIVLNTPAAQQFALALPMSLRRTRPNTGLCQFAAVASQLSAAWNVETGTAPFHSSGKKPAGRPYPRPTTKDLAAPF